MGTCGDRLIHADVDTCLRGTEQYSPLDAVCNVHSIKTFMKEKRDGDRKLEENVCKCEHSSAIERNLVIRLQTPVMTFSYQSIVINYSRTKKI